MRRPCLPRRRLAWLCLLLLGPLPTQAGNPLPDGAAARLGKTDPLRGAQILAAAFTPDGQRVAFVLRWPGEQHVCLHDVATGREVRAFQGWDEWILHLAISPDGRTLAASSPKVVYLWDLKMGGPPRRVRGHPQGAGPVAFSPDSKLLAVAGGWWPESKDFAVRLWDVASGREVRRLEGHAGAVAALAFSADGKRLVGASTAERGEGEGKPARRGRAGVWEVATGRVLRTLDCPEGEVAVAPGARVLALRTPDGLLRLRDLETGRDLGTIEDTLSFAFSPDGKALAVSRPGLPISLSDC